METHREPTVAIKASTPKRRPWSLIDAADRAARLAAERLRSPALIAERQRVRTVADASVGLSGA